MRARIFRYAPQLGAIQFNGINLLFAGIILVRREVSYTGFFIHPAQSDNFEIALSELAIKFGFPT